MAGVIINVNMPPTTANLNNVIIAPSAPLLAMSLTPQDELLKVMEKIWTTLNLSQKEALIAQATRASFLNQAIDHLLETQTAALKVKKVRENDNV